MPGRATLVIKEVTMAMLQEGDLQRDEARTHLHTHSSSLTCHSPKGFQGGRQLPPLKNYET